MPSHASEAARSHLSTARFVLAGASAAALVLSGPYAGLARDAIKSALSNRFGAVVNAGMLVLAVGAVGLVLVRIRTRRGLRYGALIAAAVLGVAYGVGFAAGSADTRAVERLHFLEYGVVTWLFYRAWRPLDTGVVPLLAGLCGVLVGLADELLQWYVPLRVGELRDVALDAAAIGCGALVSLALDPPSAWRRGAARSRRPLGTLAAVVVVALTAFSQIVHLGYAIQDPDVGVFRSRYTDAQLEALGAERASAWRANPPAALHRLGREDQYLAEGIWHVQRRNRAWTAGDLFASWRENLILERYFRPVLDTPSYLAPDGVRWPPAQRADAAARTAGTAARPYVSRADLIPIVVWPAVWVWTIAGVLAGLALVAGWAGRSHFRGLPGA